MKFKVGNKVRFNYKEVYNSWDLVAQTENKFGFVYTVSSVKTYLNIKSSNNEDVDWNSNFNSNGTCNESWFELVP